MNQTELNTILEEVNLKLLESRFSHDEISKRIEEFSTNGKTIDSKSLAQFFFLENLDFTRIYLKEVLSKALCK